MKSNSCGTVAQPGSTGLQVYCPRTAGRRVHAGLWARHPWRAKPRARDLQACASLVRRRGAWIALLRPSPGRERGPRTQALFESKRSRDFHGSDSCWRARADDRCTRWAASGCRAWCGRICWMGRGATGRRAPRPPWMGSRPSPARRSFRTRPDTRSPGTAPGQLQRKEARPTRVRAGSRSACCPTPASRSRSCPRWSPRCSRRSSRASRNSRGPCAGRSAGRGS